MKLTKVLVIGALLLISSIFISASVMASDFEGTQNPDCSSDYSDVCSLDSEPDPSLNFTKITY